MFSENTHALYRRRISEIDMLRFRSQWLSDKDKVLMQMVFDNGSTFDQIARLTGENPSTVSRRFHRLVQKLINRQLLPMLRNHHNCDSITIRIVRDYYLKGHPQKTIARTFNVSLYRVRNVLRAVRAVAAAGGLVTRKHRRNKIGGR